MQQGSVKISQDDKKNLLSVFGQYTIEALIIHVLSTFFF